MSKTQKVAEKDRIKIILDCDPGHDDAVAIIMAASHPKIDLLGVTVVAGNQTIRKTTENALNVVQKIGREDIKVYQGCGGPMVRNRQVIADDIHGVTGLDGPVFDELNIKKDKMHAVDFIIKTLMESEDKITLVPTGPLTNIAMAMRMEPKIINKIERIVLMGGAYQLGNTTPAAEFNIYADAEAAYVVTNSGLPIVMMTLDMTRQTLCYPEIVERMRKLKTVKSDLFCDLMEFFGSTQKKVFGWAGGPLHDPTCIAYLIDESIIETKDMFVEVEIRSEKSYGRTLCDYFGVTGKTPNAKVSLKSDTVKFWNLVEECLK